MKNSAPEDINPEPIQEKVLFSWEAPVRHFEKKSKEFYINILAIFSVIALIIFIAEGWVPVVLLISLGFLYFVMHSVEPEIVKYQITNLGLRIKDGLFDWTQITNFWITQKDGIAKLNLGIISIPRKLEILINQRDKEKIREILREYLVESEIPPSRIERLIEWFSAKIEK